MSISSAVYKATAEGDLEELRRILQADAGLVNAADAQGRSPLHLAAENGHSEAVRFLLDNGADVHNKTLHGPTALHLAALMGQAEVVRVLLQRGAKVGCVGSIGSEALTPLHFAAMNGQAEVVDVLLSHKARVGVKGEEGSTPLHMALMSEQVVLPNRIAIVKQLLAHKADCSVQNSHRETPHEIALRKGFTETAALFRAAGSKTKSEIFQLIRDDDYKSAKKLLEGADGVAGLEENCDKPHHVAARCARPAIMHLLLERGADLNAQNRQGNTALHLAVLHLHEVHRHNEDDEKASQTMIKILSFEPALAIQNNEGQTAWDVAFGCDEDQVCFWIDEANLLQKAHQANIAEIRYTVVEADDGPEVRDAEATNWDVELVPLSDDDLTGFSEYFLARRNWYGGLGFFDDNPLGKLIWNVFSRRVSPDYLVDHPKGEIRAVMTFLRVVAAGDLEEIKNYLAENPWLADSSSNLRRSRTQSMAKIRSPLSIAAENGREDICHLLLEAGADVNKGDDVYNSPLTAAAWEDHLSTVTLLLQAGIETRVIKESLKKLEFLRSHREAVISKMQSVLKVSAA